MFSRKTFAAAGAAAVAATMFLGPVAVASADDSTGFTGSATGSAESGSAGSSTGSAGSSAGSSMLDSGSSAFDGGTSAIVNIIEALTGARELAQPAAPAEPAA
ncbi:hypothetical protein AB0H49_19425 [Nocardia sp. NPDC050713]|uniref:hypothetical protein n=1 Tax=unclassified Nocardia TaxID=2637762 RepID=UPI0033BB9D53